MGSIQSPGKVACHKFQETETLLFAHIPYRFLWRSPTAWSRGDEVLVFSSRQVLTEGPFYLRLEHLLKRRTPQKFSFFLPLLYYGNRFAVVSFFQCSLSTWSFLFRLHQNHPTERDVVFKYSRLPITRTFKGNRKKVRVIGSSSYRELEENSRD